MDKYKDKYDATRANQMWEKGQKRRQQQKEQGQGQGDSALTHIEESEEGEEQDNPTTLPSDWHLTSLSLDLSNYSSKPYIAALVSGEIHMLKRNVFVLDSGTTRHSVGDESLLHEVEPVPERKLTLLNANGKTNDVYC